MDMRVRLDGRLNEVQTRALNSKIETRTAESVFGYALCVNSVQRIHSFPC